MKLKEVVRHILDPELRLRDRLFQLLSAIALAEFVVVSVYTAVSGGDAAHIAIMLAGTVLFTLTVSFTFRTGRMRLGATVSGLLYFLMYPMTFFQSGGMYGGAPAVFTFALVYVFLVTQRWERVLSMALCVLGSGVCYFLAWRYPELLTRHTVPAEHLESILSVLLVTLLLCALFAFVTEVYREENRIVQKQKREIEELNQAQKRFFSAVSHEIRTPVNAIIGLNELTLREKVPEEVLENARHMDSAGKLLLHTVNEILDLSRLETGTMEIVPGDYRTGDMLADLESLIGLQAREKGLEFRILTDGQLPSALHGDEVRIKQVLLNILSNAVKYTMSGSVTLSVGGSREGKGIFRAVYTVADTGIGIRQEELPHLFTPFLRLDERNTHAIEGSGLGLSIVRQLLDLMGGDVRVESEYGKGSVFRVEIPQTVADDRPLGQREAKTAERIDVRRERDLPAGERRVLAVDDTPMNLLVVKKLLRDSGAEVDTAGSGAEALEKTLEKRYDVIFMDHRMPEMDGLECLRRIRAQEGGLCRESPIVCLTADEGGEMAARYLEAGFDGYLTKPVRGSELASELDRLTGV